MIQSVYWIELGRKMVNKTLYVFDTSDVRLYLENVYRHFVNKYLQYGAFSCVEVIPT
jgi:hypothetical protein